MRRDASFKGKGPTMLLRGIITAALLILASTAQAGDEDAWWAQSEEPARRHWELTSFLSGTSEKIKEILDKEPLSAHKKIGDAKEELRLIGIRYEQERKFLVKYLHEKPEYRKAAKACEQLAAKLEKARKSGTTAEKMEASSRYNRARAKLQELDARVPQNPILTNLRRKDRELRAKITVHREALAKSLAWRKELVDAIAVSFTLRGPVTAGESCGILGTIMVDEIGEEGSFIGTFALLSQVAEQEKGEGIVTARYVGQEVPVVVQGFPDTTQLLRGQPVTITHTYRVARVVRLSTGEALVLERHPTDAEHLLNVVLAPPVDHGTDSDVPPLPKEEAIKKEKPSRRKAR